ncbi:BTAD domain-containing putative transcriptional regulator [Streptomyces sp. bgisy100]|uniref:AfsR/SARP family transcriptional regulator n=1 Tax=Streptomyces sp. bgisy100 TaxID=3413783 RepID=UPI003D75E17D
MTAGAETVRYALLDRLRAWRGTEEVELGSRQQRTLLALLLLRQGAPLSVDGLVAGVWGQDPPLRAVGALRTYVSRLRKLLEPRHGTGGAPAVLVSEHGGYVLRVPVEAVDLGRFQQDVAAAELARAAGRPGEARELLRTALALWGEEPLAGLGGPGIEAERARLSARRLSALESRLALDVELGEQAAVLGELRELTERHPLRERLGELLMRALVLSGQEAEALAVYERTRRVLAAEFGLDPGHEMASLAGSLPLRRAPAGAPAPGALPEGATASGTGTMRSGYHRPAQLPRDLADFTGRDGAVERVTGALTTAVGRAVPVVLVSGMAGVGKSALAVHAAHRVRGHFPHGQLYADLRAPDGGPADLAGVLGSFLRALRGPVEPIPESVADRVSLYRTELAERRVLVFLDNVTDPEPIGPLLPGGPACAALITSGVRTTAPAGAGHTHLDALTPDEVLAWLEKAIGPERVAAEPEACARLAEVCGGLPLAVRILAMRLATRPSWTVASVVEGVSGRNRPAGLRVADLSVEGVFQREYARLPVRLRRVLPAVARSADEDGIIGTAALTGALGRSAHAAHDLCEELVDVSWVESAAPGHYRIHGLLQEFVGAPEFADAREAGGGPGREGGPYAEILFAPGDDGGRGGAAARRLRPGGQDDLAS